MEKKVVIIPDVHGRKFWRDALPYIEDGTPVVFLGDYLDPYDHEGITPEDALENFKEILEATKEKRNVTLLIGNHDTTYIWPDAHLCECRTDYNNKLEISMLFNENLNRFMLHRLYTQGDMQFLFTHAGVHDIWLDSVRKEYDLSDDKTVVEALDILDNAAHNEDITALSLLGRVSHLRDGWSPIGSCIWADIDEFILRPSGGNTEYTQIVGHTQQLTKIGTENGGFKWVGDKPVYDLVSNIFCLDCHKCFYIDEEGDVRYLTDNKLAKE